LSTTNSTWTDPGSISGLLRGRPATNRLSHGTAYQPTTFMDYALELREREREACVSSVVDDLDLSMGYW
jgi:hypothetical protein